MTRTINSSGPAWSRTGTAETARIGHRYPMRAALLALVLANAGFSGEHARVASGKQPRPTRVVERATDAPSGWTATRDRDTGAIVSVWGGSIRVAGSIADAAIAERAAREFATQLLPSRTTFVVVSNRVEHGKRTVAFQQTMHGLRVIGAHVFVVFQHDRLFAAGSSAVPVAHIDVPSARAGIAKTEAWLRTAGIAASVNVTGERAVLPLIYGRGDFTAQVVDVLEARAGLESWTVYATSEGTPLVRVSKVAHGTGTVRMDVPVRHPGGSRTKLPATRANLVVDGIPLTASTTGAVGWSGNAAATVVPSTVGEFVRVIDAAGSPATGALTLANGSVVDWSLATSAAGDAQLSAYAWAMVAKKRARGIHPTLSWLDRRLDITVNEAGSCNALSDGDALHFYGAGACENAARITDVVLHEFGHSFHTQAHLAGAFSSALGEGLADFFAANITGDPGIGRGLNFDDEAVRDVEPDLVFPDDVSGDEHVTGLIVAGALWDLRKSLAGGAAIEAIYLGVVEHATDLSTAYVGALIGDDDDGDLGNGTPHQCLIEQAFSAHGLVPDFAKVTLTTPVLDGRTLTVDVQTPGNSACAQPQVTRMQLVVQLDGVEETFEMLGNGTRFVGTLPEVAGPIVIRYRVVAYLDDESELAMPDNPGDPLYQLFVGTLTPLYCDTFEVDPQWTQSGRMAWEFGRPLGRAGDPPRPFTGEAVLGTTLRDSGRYPAGSTAITTQPLEIAAYTELHLQFRRWLTVEERSADRAAISIDGTIIWQNSAEGFDHVDREWRFVDVPMPPGERITFSIDANSELELGGWNLDDLCVVTYEPNACAGCEPPPSDGCCSSSGNSASLLLGLGVLGLLLRRRARWTREPSPRIRRASRARPRVAHRADRSPP